ncbi:metal-dependent hydrolase family protein [Methanobrevibacter woesei]|uniref:metal-dependent hydrolase family protein n=1 Tax=Methanobrevibacter woesei TaxID=190976 RepID=UPI00235384A8|nr:amidohydrolase family protein [Methanobrevibacter woesei]
METLIKNINIINPYKEVEYNCSILIKDDIIAEISNSKIKTKDNVKVIDGQDNFLLPGFIDCHTHILAKGFHKEENMSNPLSIHFYNAVPHSKETIFAGVTSIRDCGSADLGVKMAQERGLFLAPKITISITPLMCTGGHFDLFMPSGFDMEIIYPGFPKGRCDGVDEVLKKTREVKRAGADFIKVMASGGVLTTNSSPDYPQFNIEELRTIAIEAGIHGKKVSAHCHSLQGIKNCVDAGFDSIEHGTFIDRNTSRKMAENGTILVPTILVHDFLYRNGFPKWDNFASEKTAKLKEIVKVHKENISVAYEEGVKILFGTDSGVIPHGHNLEELSNLVDIGMSPSEAIASGTIEAAKFINQNDKIGSVETGKVADLIITSQNPLEDIKSLANRDNILTVFQDGIIVKN